MQKFFKPKTEFRNQFIVSAIQFGEKMCFEVYDTDNPAGEVWLSNFYFERALKSDT